MKWWDSLFYEYGNPIFLLDSVIASGQFYDWVKTRQEEKNERMMWEYYIHKLGSFDERSFNEFREDIMSESGKFIPTEEQQIATIQTSKSFLESFDFISEGGQE